MQGVLIGLLRKLIDTPYDKPLKVSAAVRKCSLQILKTSQMVSMDKLTHVIFCYSVWQTRADGFPRVLSSARITSLFGSFCLGLETRAIKAAFS